MQTTFAKFMHTVGTVWWLEVDIARIVVATTLILTSSFMVVWLKCCSEIIISFQYGLLFLVIMGCYLEFIDNNSQIHRAYLVSRTLFRIHFFAIEKCFHSRVYRGMCNIPSGFLKRGPYKICFSIKAIACTLTMNAHDSSAYPVPIACTIWFFTTRTMLRIEKPSVTMLRYL